jgi:dTDP-4-amino-4,6-dideoxygalactose transaminase
VTDVSPPLLLSPPDVGDSERRLLLEAFDSGWVAPAGPALGAFEADVAARLGVHAAVALSSGTAALHLALQLLGVGRGDTVLVPTLTFAATANPVRYLGATPVFVDCDLETWTVDPVLVEDELGARARRGAPPAAVVAVDLYGQCADYDRLADACARFEVPLLADAAESLGSTYRGREAGAVGAAAALSFNGNKIVTAGGGGMLVSDDETLVSRARHLATQAREPVPHYEHQDVGYNYRMSNLLAAVGRGQLQSLDAKVAARRATYAAYRRLLADVPGVSMMPLADRGESNCWLSCVTVDPDEFGASRDDVREHLERAGVEARPTWKPMHLQPVFAAHPRRGGTVAEGVFARGLCLPSGSRLTDADRARVVETLVTTPRATRAQRAS